MAPDPSGVYMGSAVLSIGGQPGVIQIWRIDLQAEPCPECLPGQYFVSGTNFTSVDYGSGLTERGGVRGFINPTGDALDLNLLTVNCPFLNPSASVEGAPYAGRARGGSFGETHDQALRIQGGSMTGRISGRDCFGRTLTANVSLQRQTAPVPAACQSIAGSYAASFTTSTGGTGGGSVVILQDGCFFAAYLPGLGGQLEGVMTSPTTANIHVNDPCASAIHLGSLSVNGSAINGSYSGTATGASGCPSGTVSGTFILTRN